MKLHLKTSPGNFKKVAIQAARKAGSIHKKYFNSKLKIGKKRASYDLVTIVDVKSEKAIARLIKKHFRDHNILAEEFVYKETKSEYKWIIDPLDGTNNFSHGMPIFCVSIALAKNNEVILGVVFDPIREEMFVAEKNIGAFLNGKRIKVCSDTSLDKAILITGFYYNRGKEMEETLDNIKKFLLKKIIGIRRLGSAALDLSYVACGRATGFWEFMLSPWDFAAGKLLIEEAGGKITDNFGKGLKLEKSFIVASNGKIHTKMLEVIN